jgi:predicted DNA-binding transcriptional regulator AlpA
MPDLASIADADLDELLRDLPDLLSRKHVIRLLGVSRPTLLVWIATGRFPKPLVVSRATHRWTKATARCWLQQLCGSESSGVADAT